MACADDDRVVRQKLPPGGLRRGDALVTKAGYRGAMAAEAFCTTCQRMVYIEDGETAVCPVCSSPLLRSTESGGEDDEDRAEESATS